MHPDELYVLEVVIYRIELEPNIFLHERDGLIVNFKFSQRVNFDIDTSFFMAPKINDGPNLKTIEMNYGKTFLFVSKPSELKQLMHIEPYQIILLDGNNNVATAMAKWKKEFLEIVKNFEKHGTIKSATVEDWYKLLNDKEEKVGRIKAFLRMTCFGHHIETMFHIQPGPGHKQEYMFRQKDASKTFKVDRYREDKRQILYGPIEHRGDSLGGNIGENASWTQLYNTDIMTPNISEFQGPDEGDTGITLDFSFSDMLSLCVRPSENKFFDLMNIISADVKTHTTGTCVTLQKTKSSRAGSTIRSIGGSQRTSHHEENDITAEEINKKLCKSKDCPAVRKFKEYGLGPLADEYNLGPLNDDLEPSVLCGMSHFNGTMENYGPYGGFSRPKYDELPYVPLEHVSEPVKPCKATKVMKLNCSKSFKVNPQWHSQSCPLCPERLRGGSNEGEGHNMQSGKPSLKVDDGIIAPKSPLAECKSIMDQFDSILAQSKIGT